MLSFMMNGDIWYIRYVKQDSNYLVDRTGFRTVGVTDPVTHEVYISNDLRGRFKQKVLIHEICHCALVSYHLIDDIRDVVRPSDWIMAEEWVCNLLANYGMEIFSAAYEILGDDAITLIPESIAHMIRR